MKSKTFRDVLVKTNRILPPLFARSSNRIAKTTYTRIFEQERAADVGRSSCANGHEGRAPPSTGTDAGVLFEAGRARVLVDGCGNAVAPPGGDQGNREDFFSGNKAKVEAHQAFESLAPAGRSWPFEGVAPTVEEGGSGGSDDSARENLVQNSTPVTPSSGLTPLGVPPVVEADGAVFGKEGDGRMCVRRGASHVIAETLDERSCVLTPVLSEDELGDAEGVVAMADWLDAVEAMLR